MRTSYGSTACALLEVLEDMNTQGMAVAKKHFDIVDKKINDQARLSENGGHSRQNQLEHCDTVPLSPPLT